MIRDRVTAAFRYADRHAWPWLAWGALCAAVGIFAPPHASGAFIMAVCVLGLAALFLIDWKRT